LPRITLYIVIVYNIILTGRIFCFELFFFLFLFFIQLESRFGKTFFQSQSPQRRRVYYIIIFHTMLVLWTENSLPRYCNQPLPLTIRWQNTRCRVYTWVKKSSQAVNEMFVKNQPYIRHWSFYEYNLLEKH